MSREEFSRQLKVLADEYERVWMIADKEKRDNGKVSKETNKRLCEIEVQLMALEQ